MNESGSDRLVFAGNGMSSVACVEELLKTGRAFDITIFGDEPHANYDRTLLASVLAGERDADSIILNNFEWYQEHGIRTRLGIRVEEIDPVGRAVRSSDGDWTDYDRLILATGASPRMPDVAGLDGVPVIVFDTLDDTRRVVEAAGPGVRVAVIGGWLAAEAARSLRKRGCEAVVVEEDAIEKAIDTDLVVIATDLVPNIELARAAGLKVNRGIVVNDQMETSDPFICALGGCTEHNGRIFESLPLLLDQARVLARNLAGARERGFIDLDAMFQELAASPRHQRAE